MSESKKSMLAAGRPSARKDKAATLASLADKAETIRLNFDLDREEHKKLKLRAVQNGTTIAEIMRDLVKEFNAKHR